MLVQFYLAGHNNKSGDEETHTPRPLLLSKFGDMGRSLELPSGVSSRDKSAGGVVLQLLQDSWYISKHLHLDTTRDGNPPFQRISHNRNQLSYSPFNFLGQTKLGNRPRLRVVCSVENLKTMLSSVTKNEAGELENFPE